MRHLTYFFIFLFFVTSCSSNEEPPLVLTTIRIVTDQGIRLDVVSSEQTTLQLDGFDQNNQPFEINDEILWSVENDHATITQNGVLTAQSVGTAIVVAQVSDLRAEASLSIWDSSAPRTEIYVSDVGNDRNGPHRIWRYDENGEHPEAFISTALSRPQDIIFLEDQQIVLVSNLGGNNINQYDIETGEFKGTFAANLNGPTRIDIGPDRLIYAIQWNGGPVRRYEQDGTFVDDFTDTSIDEAIGMAWDNQRNLYVASFNDGGSGFVLQFDPEGNQIGTFINTNLVGPTDIWFDGSDMLVNDWSANSVKRFDSEGVFLETFISGVAQPEGVATLNGNLLLGASGSSSVPMYTSNGSFVSNRITPGKGGLITPNAVVVRRVNP
ncbi:MAG: hypothetical protein R8G66_11280 [Cytophagales bacterium]|nr:hypothetical protein [Cytophagales bacterium]